MERYEKIKVTPTEALDIFLNEYPEAVVHEIELETKRAGFIYEVEGIIGDREHELKIDAMTGDIIEMETKILRNTHSKITRTATELVEPLVEKVLKEAGPGVTLRDYELDIEDGGYELTIRLVTGAGVRENHKYDLETGALIRKK